LGLHAPTGPGLEVFDWYAKGVEEHGPNRSLRRT
jgi:hypothetical protein